MSIRLPEESKSFLPLPLDVPPKARMDDKKEAEGLRDVVIHAVAQRQIPPSSPPEAMPFESKTQAHALLERHSITLGPHISERDLRIAAVSIKLNTAIKLPPDRASGTKKEPVRLAQLGSSQNPVTKILAIGHLSLQALARNVPSDLYPPDSSRLFYKKDDIMAMLRQMAQVVIEDETASEISKILSGYMTSTSDFIEEKEVFEIVGLVKMPLTVKAMLSSGPSETRDYSIGLPDAYVAVSDLIALQAAKPANMTRLMDCLDKTIKDVYKNGSAHYAFKVGVENTRELLAGQLLPSLQLNTFVVSKEAVKLKQASLAGISNPQGIASEWLEGGAFPTQAVDAFAQCKKALALERLRLETTPRLVDPKKLKELELRFERSKALIGEAERKMGVTHPHSIKQQMLVDALLCSYDSHAAQYVIKGGNYYNIDFSRFLPLKETCSLDSRTTYLALRSEPLDHPAADLPLEKTEVEQILQMDPEKIEADWKEKGLIGERGDFAKAQQHMRDLQIEKKKFAAFSSMAANFHSEVILSDDDYTAPDFDFDDPSIDPLELTVIDYCQKQLSQKLSEVDVKKFEDILSITKDPGLPLRKFLKDNNLPFSETDSSKKLAAAVDAHFDNEIHKVKEKCFTKIHPEAVLSFKKRLLNMQGYLLKCRESGAPSTMGQAMHSIYPRLSPFFKVSSALYGTPFGLPPSTPLEKIIETAENLSGKGDHPSLEQEIKDMRVALKDIKENSCSLADMSMTMNL